MDRAALLQRPALLGFDTTRTQCRSLHRRPRSNRSGDNTRPDHRVASLPQRLLFPPAARTIQATSPARRQSMLRVWQSVDEVAVARSERTKNAIAIRSGEEMWMNDGTLRVTRSTGRSRGDLFACFTMRAGACRPGSREGWVGGAARDGRGLLCGREPG